MAEQWKNNKQKGIGMIEVMISLAIIVIVFFSFILLIKINLQIQRENQNSLKALNLATETMEAVRSFKENDWSAFSSLSTASPYYPVISGNEWTLSESDPGEIDSFSRWIEIEEVYRDANDNIAETGNLDNKSREIKAFVQWEERSRIKQITLSSILTNWKNQ